MKQVLFFLFIFTSSAFAMNVSCDPASTEHMPEVPVESSGLINNLENREFDPCAVNIEPAKSKAELCARTPRDFQAMLCTKKGRMGFSNNKGLFGLPTGVCWWHSQFHRNATYLAAFNPEKPKLDPNKKEDRRELKQLIKSIAKRKGMVEIPGYASLKEFTEDPEIEKLVQKRLQKWMAEDSFLKMQWVNGLSIPDTYTKKSPEFYTKQMGWIIDPFKDHGDEKINARAQRKFERRTYDSEEEEQRKREKTLRHQNEEVVDLFESVNDRDEIGYITLQYPGVMAHAQVVFDAEKITNEDGTVEYEFKVQDSNYQHPAYEEKWSKKSYSKIKYKDGIWYMKVYGKNNITDGDYEPINIALHKERQLKKINDIYLEECEQSLFPSEDEAEN
tara:strand:- start:197908 stop:199074 length:1167 start_codon:yes stop_codon:yes gene_type:complete